MDIGTAKPTTEEQQQAPHHLLDVLPPDQNFSLGMFLPQARQAIHDTVERGKVPIVVGGTGQYIWALREGWNVPEVPPDAEFRQQMEAEAANKGTEHLYHRLQAVDPDRAREIGPRNLRRLIRSLEVHHLTGHAPSSFGREPDRETPGLILAITMQRPILYDLIDRRVEHMLEQGFQSEVRRLSDLGYRVGEGPLASPGYRELGQHFAGEIPLDAAVRRTKFQTHRLARRQYTWFKPSDSRINWLEGDASYLTTAAAEIVSAWLVDRRY